jgi:hypothetical protein
MASSGVTPNPLAYLAKDACSVSDSGSALGCKMSTRTPHGPTGNRRRKVVQGQIDQRDALDLIEAHRIERDIDLGAFAGEGLGDGTPDGTAPSVDDGRPIFSKRLVMAPFSDLVRSDRPTWVGGLGWLRPPGPGW